jgi:hypothetical protein
MNFPPLYSPEGIEAAAARLQDKKTQALDRAIWFRNSLRALLEDVEHAQLPTPPIKIMAVDTTEILSATSYNKSAFTAFAFGGLLDQAPNGSDNFAEQDFLPNAELETIDKLILQYLLEHRNDRYLLLDSQAEEVVNLQRRHEQSWNKATGRVYNAALDRFRGFEDSQLENILTFLKTRSPAAIPDEWKRFREEFLPNWRSDMLDQVWKRSKSLASIEALIKNGKYLFLRPSWFGARSLLRFLNATSFKSHPIEWEKFDQFAKTSGVAAQYDETYAVVRKLLAVTPRGEFRTKEELNTAAERDARALATVHTWNSFFICDRVNARIELVTRTHALHRVVASLLESSQDQRDQEAKLQVTLRHPFLLPDIYQFDPKSLAAIGVIVNAIDGVIGPYLRAAPADADPKVGDGDPRFSDAQKAALGIVPLLRDIVPVQQGLELPRSTALEIYRETIFSDTAKKPAKHGTRRNGEGKRGGDPLIVEKIEAVFKAIKEQLRNRNDPISQEAILALVERNSALVQFEGDRIFATDRDERITFRVFDFRSESSELDRSTSHDETVLSLPCLTVRPVGAAGESFSRLVFIHSPQLIALISAGLDTSTSGDEKVPTEFSLPVSVILGGVKEALSALKTNPLPRDFGKDAAPDPVAVASFVLNLNATLLAALVFASKRRFDTALSLTSTILHQITGEIRRGGWRSSYRVGDIRLSLAYRELFLLRHYCERAVAMDDYLHGRSGSTAVSRNFARAQRDLDFAALMAEDAERIRADKLRVESKQLLHAVGATRPERGELRHEALQVTTDEPSEVAAEMEPGVDEVKHEGSPAAPAGVDNFEDFRLKLAHFAGWVDQFLIASHDRAESSTIDWQDSESDMRLRRFSIWTAAGLVKDIVTDAYFAHKRRMAISAESRAGRYQRRYFAYVEARALESALILFIIFMAYRVSRDMVRLWLVTGTSPPDRILIYREWHDWWRRYDYFHDHFKFEFRTYGLIAAVCRALFAIQGLRANPEDAGNPRSYAEIIANLKVRLEEASEKEDAGRFIKTITEALLVTIRDLPLETDAPKK